MSLLPTGIFGQYYLDQLWRRNIANLGHKYMPLETKKRQDKRDLVCAICGKEKELLAPVSPFRVSPEGLKRMHPQPQMLIGGMVMNKKGELVVAKVPSTKFRFNAVYPMYDPEGIYDPITKKKSKNYYIVYNAYVCRKCIWHVLGGQKGKLKVDGEVVEY